MTDFEAGREFARAMDEKDPLAAFRRQFNFPDDRDGRRNVYVCGNSLGLQPKAAPEYVNEVLADWAHLGVEGHLRAKRPWLDYHRRATAGFAELTGAEPQEVVAMNTLTVNLHVLMTSFYRPDSRRHKIVVESTAFPSDYFAVTSQLELHGLDPADALIEWIPRDDDRLYDEDLQQILDEHGDEIALLLLPGVQYYTGQVLNMEKLCRMARDAGCRVGLDLAHAIGNVPLQLHDWGPDFAAWCTYKYLNSGPGAVGGAFVHSRHLGGNESRHLAGWWGHDESTRFEMSHRFVPAPGVERWQLSNPPILAIAPILASLAIFRAAGIEALWEKSLRQTSYLAFLLERNFAGRIGTITPFDARGCQLSLVVTDDNLDARGVFRSLERLNVSADWREPNVIRVAPVPLYNSFEDVFELCERLQQALADHEPG
jgi:kynureninase